jgi:hypothetical protein
MTSRRDLVEAHAFGRRRLATALVAGAPGGREAEPARPGRPVGGGVLLATLLVIAFVVVGRITGGEPDGWDRPGLLVSEGTGALYVILEKADEPELHAVANVTSARLLLGADPRPTVVGEDTIAAQRRGDDLGIPEAPATLPAVDRLVESGWTACASDGHETALALSATPDVRPLAGAGLTVRSGGLLHVVATSRTAPGEPALAHRYPLPAGAEPDPLLAALGLPIAAEAIEVPASWLRTLPVGGPLDLATFGLQGYGDPAPGQGPGGLPTGARIGQLLTLDGERFQVLTGLGPAELDPFALALYRALPKPTLAVPLDPDPIRLDAPPQVAAAVPPYAGARWPDTLPAEQLGQPCALLVTSPDDEPVVRLATDPGETASRAGVWVEPGGGALVELPDGGLVLVDARGAAHRVADDEAADHLGYGATDAPLVPQAWLDLLSPGVTLSREAALCPGDAVVSAPRCGR